MFLGEEKHNHGRQSMTHDSTTGSVPLTERYLLRVDEAAVMLGTSRSKLYALISAGEVPSVKLGGSRRVPVEALKAWIARLGLSDAA